MARLTSSARAELKELVLFESADLIAGGKSPTAKSLATRIPGRRPHVLSTLRDELRREGRLVWTTGHGVRMDLVNDAAARDEADFEARIERQCKIRAAKMAQGEFGGPSEPRRISLRHRHPKKVNRRCP